MIAVIDVIYSVLKAHLIILVILILSYIIEQITPLSLFVDQFKWKKSPRNAEIHVSGDSLYYLIIVLIVFIYDIYHDKIELNFISILAWLVIMIPLFWLFRILYRKYQGVDTNKADVDFS